MVAGQPLKASRAWVVILDPQDRVREVFQVVVLTDVHGKRAASLSVERGGVAGLFLTEPDTHLRFWVTGQ